MLQAQVSSWEELQLRKDDLEAHAYSWWKHVKTHVLPPQVPQLLRPALINSKNTWICGTASRMVDFELTPLFCIHHRSLSILCETLVWLCCSWILSLVGGDLGGGPLGFLDLERLKCRYLIVTFRSRRLRVSYWRSGVQPPSWNEMLCGFRPVDSPVLPIKRANQLGCLSVGFRDVVIWRDLGLRQTARLAELEMFSCEFCGRLHSEDDFQ